MNNEQFTDNSQKKKKPPGARERESEVKRKVEFTKLILLLAMLAYFVVVGVGIKITFIDTTQYSTLALLVGAPTATAIGFYAWKAKAENVLKIHKENKDETGGAPFDPGNMI